MNDQSSRITKDCTNEKRSIIFIEAPLSGTGEMIIEAALALGFHSIMVVKAPERYKDFGVSNFEMIVADTDDTEATIARCEAIIESGYSVRCIMSVHELHVLLAAEVAERLGFPTNRPEDVATCRNKYLQRQRLPNDLCPAFAFAKDRSQIEMASRSVGFPLVSKAPNLAGSIFVRRCNTLADVQEFYDEFTRSQFVGGEDQSPGILLEELMGGVEYSVELLDGKVITISGKMLGQEPFFVDLSHIIPADITEAAAGIIRKATMRAVKTLGITRGAVCAELKLIGDQVKIIEINPRVAGDMVPRLVKHGLGFDFMQAIVLSAVGEPYEIDVDTDSSVALIRFLPTDRAGVVTNVGSIETAISRRQVIDAGISVVEGQKIRPTDSSLNRLGWVIVKAETHAAAEHAALKALPDLDIAIDGVPVLERTLSSQE